MTPTVQGLNPAAWQTLGELAATPSGQTEHLPSVSKNSPAWNAFKSDASIRAPYISQLNHSVQGIQQFIREQAMPGAERQQALNNLQHFLNSRVNCRSGDLAGLTINENRQNLHLFAQQLKNPAISPDKKLGAALSLAQGLGVCEEGETLNILESTQQLCQQQTGLAGVLVSTKNTLIEQHLQQVVKREDKTMLRPNQAKAQEIHHVQALKNHVASQWGLSAVEDRYATTGYQTQMGRLAAAVLEQTITPKLLANVVADKLQQAFVNHTANGLLTGMPSEQLKTEPLRQAIQAEFGHTIELEQCLEFNDDYTEVRLKPQSELALHVMHAFKDIGLIHPHANPQHLLDQDTVNIEQAIERSNHLRGPTEYISRGYDSFVPSFWFGLGNIADKSHNKKDADERMPSKSIPKYA